jgi:hypothetical protein
MAMDTTGKPTATERRPSRRWLRISGVSHATVVAYIALFMAMGGTAVAATGGSFILGKSNSADAVSTLTNSTGPALSLRAPSGSAPLRVNRTVKVANLNADLLDGRDSSAFVSKASFDALKAQHTALKAQHTALAAKVATLEQSQASQASEIAALQTLLAGVSRVEVDGHPTIRFSDVNVQIVNGTGTTSGLPNGRGNLIVGYSAQRTPTAASRTGSHYVVVGDQHSWTKFGGIVSGFRNTVSGFGASVLGGIGNTASGDRATVSGGGQNTASGYASSVLGGKGNAAVSGEECSVICIPRIENDHTTVVGGTGNIASGLHATVTGGEDNVSSGTASSILGGKGRTVDTAHACQPACG